MIKARSSTGRQADPQRPARSPTSWRSRPPAGRAAPAAKGDARIDRLIHDGHPIAASITLRSHNAAWFWKIAYDESFARSSPGVQLTLDLTRDLLGDAALA